ncbi:2-isopropylmalate synthase [Clostridium tetanomorphum]|uniref:2-isopropylmalate synthase n=1 Tax=Clostridium tetanomorphum TaxID=1553 RepID=A0A923IZ91_CLOTT|nr:2-isopropylmalate synthase [Clostridium tetanomorphum]KAJ51409.1 2-isopropylmalate synthase [Clostridium tetanomorphum DSM 665]MBC2396384.1 2-isopropylmalate synthase [Clostridium tetanomorphum]MBP1863386.1 2-isopropylmalate synthase [Clostridium tetanomorphum]NRS83483.1 2-isopropylmalate synthase [Clostridium tetanomorphum]NRZ96683.1 2-isopropylmalate synthase [Clostridium tetanomorphum]
MSRAIKIFDTTLRDGEQTPGVNLNIKEKVMIAKQLEALNVDVIEAGFPFSSKGDLLAVKAISKEIKKSTVAALCRANKSDIDCAWEAIKEAVNPRIHTFIATSDIHMKYKLEMSKEEVLEKAVQMVSYAKGLCKDVEFSAEDAYRSDPDFLCNIFSKVIKAGATVINIPDTVGYALPEDYYKFIKYIMENTEGIENVEISVHCHDDLGMAVANSLYGVMAGATQIECAINGLGERAGNAALEEIAMTIDVKKDSLGVHTNLNTKQLYRTSKLVSSLTGINVQPNKSIVGANAFAHESGIHQDGILKEKSTYEIILPESIGISNNSGIVLGKHSGRHAFNNYLEDMGIELEKEELEEAFKKFKELTDKKKNITSKDIEAIVHFKKYFNETYKLKSFQINSGNHIVSTAAVEILKGDELFTEVAVGDGSIDAAFKAVERAIGMNIKLKDYSIASVTDGKDALGEVTVKIMNGKGEIFIGKDISEDVMEASINSYINAINKMIDES